MIKHSNTQLLIQENSQLMMFRGVGSKYASLPVLAGIPVFVNVRKEEKNLFFPLFFLQDLVLQSDFLGVLKCSNPASGPHKGP